MGKRYYWLKLDKDFFKDKKMKKLRKIAGGDTYTIIYLKMMLMVLQTDGIYEYEGIEGSLAEELALELDEDEDNVEITLNYLMTANLIEEIDVNKFMLPQAIECMGSESAGAQRVRDYRERQKALQCNSDVTEVLQLCNVEKRREREEKEIEKREIIDYQQIVNMYNDTCVSFPRLTTLSDARKKAIKARLKTYTIDDFARLFNMAEQSDFLKGANNRNWSANFDWLIKDSNMAKVLDGNYTNKGNATTPKTNNNLEESYAMMAAWAQK